MSRWRHTPHLSTPSSTTTAISLGYFAPAACAVVPVHPAWLQRHSRSGVFSIAAHSALQYLLPSVVLQLQGGCSHFRSFAAINPPVRFLWGWGIVHARVRGTSASILRSLDERGEVARVALNCASVLRRSPNTERRVVYLRLVTRS